MNDPTTRAHDHVLDAHAETVETVLRCADAVAEAWPAESATDRIEVADPLRRELESVEAWARLPEVLAGAVDAARFSLPATPVAAPPYVAVTSKGPVLRATVSDGRLVVLLQAFEVERGDSESNPESSESQKSQEYPQSPRYVRGPATPGESVRVSFE